MSQLVFGQSTLESIKLSKEDDLAPKKKIKQPKLLEASAEMDNAVEFMPCGDCIKRLGAEKYVFVSVLFSIICNNCKDSFCKMANTDLVIGSIVKLKNNDIN